MQPRCVQVVEMAAILLPSRTMQTRSASREMRVPGGKLLRLADGWNSAGCP